MTVGKEQEEVARQQVVKLLIPASEVSTAVFLEDFVVNRNFTSSSSAGQLGHSRGLVRKEMDKESDRWRGGRELQIKTALPISEIKLYLVTENINELFLGGSSSRSCLLSGN